MNHVPALQGEHRMLKVQLELLRRGVAASDLDTVCHQAILVARTLMEHAEYEERLVLRPIAAYLDSQTGPVAVTRMDHHEIETLSRRLESSADDGERRQLVLSFIATAEAHMRHEETEIFPIAERLLA